MRPKTRELIFHIVRIEFWWTCQRGEAYQFIFIAGKIAIITHES